MNYDDALRIEWLSELYLQAMERQNFEAMEKLWELAAHDAELTQAFREINEGLLEEAKDQHEQETSSQIGELVDRHLPSATRIPEPKPRLTVAQVLQEMGPKASSQQLPGLAELLAQLASSTEPLPEELGLTPLTRWAETLFGPAPASFWRAFQHAAVDLDNRQNAVPHYALAARSKPRQEG
jgi:hypothetical protein